MFKTTSASRRALRTSTHLRERRRYSRLALERLEARAMLAFSVVSAEPYLKQDTVGGAQVLRLVVDFDAPGAIVDFAGSVQPADLVLDGTPSVLAANKIDDDTVEFLLPALAAGPHSVSLAAGAIRDTLGNDLVAYARNFNVATATAFTMQQNPRLQLGNAPLFAFPGGNLDRVDLLWQTMGAAGVGTEDTFTVEYRAAGASAWQTGTLNASVVADAASGRVMRSSTITGLNWNTEYEYRVRHRTGDVIVSPTRTTFVTQSAQTLSDQRYDYQATFRTRLQPGDTTNFSFAAYGDSATGTPPTGHRNVQARINQSNAAFSVLLGDNVYNDGTHLEWDRRFNTTLNPPAAIWNTSHIDYLGVGNHDINCAILATPTCDVNSWPVEQVFSTPVPVAGVTAPASPPASERPEHNYSFDYGGVHFVTFDTNAMQAPDTADMNRINGQLTWIEADLAASTARWKVVFVHHLLGGLSDQAAFTPNDPYFNPIVTRLRAAGADIFMAGHAHSYGWSYPLTGSTGANANFVNRGADDFFYASDGLVQLVSGAGGVGLNAATGSNYMAAAFGSGSGRDGFSLIDVTQNTLTVKYVAANDGAVIDSFVISKATPTIDAKDDPGITTSKNVPIDIAVLANDLFGTGALSVQSFSQPSNGTITQVGNVLRYTPNTGYIGTDTFTYTAADAVGTDTATVNITVTQYLVTRTFQQGADGYSGAVDTFLQANTPDTDNGAAASLNVDLLANLIQTLMRFDNLFGAGTGQVPLDATNVTATLSLYVTNEGSQLNFHRMLLPWTGATTFNSTGSGLNGYNAQGGIQAGTEAAAPADLISAAVTPTVNIYYDFNVTASVLSWLQNPGTNLGWAILPPTVDNSVQFVSAEGAQAQRPKLTIKYSLASNVAPVAVNDSVSTLVGAQVVIPILANDRDDNGDVLLVSNVVGTTHGSATLNADKTVTYIPDAGYTGSDSFTYTISDGVLASTATVNITITAPAAIAAANINVVQNDTGNTTASVTVTTSLSINDFQIRSGSTLGDYFVQIGPSSADDVAGGVLISSTTQNGRNNGAGFNYATSMVTGDPATGYIINVAAGTAVGVTSGAEYNVNVAAAYFPYSKFYGGWARTSTGTNADPNNLFTGSTGLTLGTHFIDNGGGVSTVNLTALGINANSSGVLLANHGKDEDNYALTRVNADGTWTVYIHDNGNDAATTEQDHVAFVYVPKTEAGLTVGRFMGDGTIVGGVSTTDFTIVKSGTGTYTLTINGQSPTSGVLIISSEGGGTNNSDNVVSYEASGNSWIIQTRDLPAYGLQDLPANEAVASFVFIPVTPTPPPAEEPVTNTLDIDAAGKLTYIGGKNLDNTLVVSDDGTTFGFADASPITVTAAAQAKGYLGNGTNTVTGPANAFSNSNISLGSGTDLVTMDSTQGCIGCPLGGSGKPIVVDGGGQAGDTLTINASVLGDSIALTGWGNSITLASGFELKGNSVTLGGGAIGTSALPIRTNASGSVTASGGAGGVYITETDGAAFTVGATGAGNIQLVNLAGELIIGGSSSTVSGNISLSSADAITISAALSAGSGTLTIAANTDGAGSEGYTQTAAGSVGTSNATANALRLTVNTPSGGTGNAVVGTANVTGDYTINTNDGSILWQVGLGVYNLPNTGAGAAYSAGSLISAANFNFTTANTGAQSIGTVAAPIQVNGAGQTRTARLNTGAGGIFFADSTPTGASWVNIAQAIATGAGNIAIVANGASEHAVTITGTVTTGSGSIRLLADDNLNIQTNGLVGGPGFSGTVRLQANIDGGSAQFFNMTGNAAIVTSNTSATAVVIEQVTTAAATNAQLHNITVGDGGTIIVNVTNGGAGATLGAATNLGGILHSATGALNAGPSGKILLVARANAIGTVAVPVNIGNGTVSASTTLTGAISLKSPGVLSTGVVNADSGAIALTGATGANVNGVLGDADTTGAITIAATTGNVVFNASPNNAAVYNLSVTSGGVSESIAGPLVARSLGVISPATWNVTLNGKLADEYTQLKILGTTAQPTDLLTLTGNPKLNIAVNYAIAAGDAFILVDNQGAGPLVGNFSTPAGVVLNSGDTFVVGNVTYGINYLGGTDNNDVILTALITNRAPTSVTLGTSTVLELAAGAEVGPVVVADPDGDTAFTYVVTDSRFTVDASGKLKLTAGTMLDFETEPEVKLKITATDLGGLSKQSDELTIAVLNVNEAPTAISLTSGGVNENVAGALVGTLGASDPDAGTIFTFTTADGRFEIPPGTNQLRLAPGQAFDYEAGATASVQIKVADNGALPLEFTQTIVVTIGDVNEAPTAIALASSPVPENAAGVLVGTLSATDPDAGDTHTFTTADARFVIENGNELRLAPLQALNFEAGATINVAVTATDDDSSSPKSSTQTVSFTVANVNEAPTAINLVGSVNENAQGALVGTLSASDPDSGSAHTFTTLDARFVITGGNQLQLAATQALDFEAGATVLVAITATDNGSPQQSFTQNVVVTIHDVNEAPTSILLTGSAVPENAGGALVGMLTASDPDAGSTHTFETLDARFVIVGGTELRLAPAQSLDFEAGATINVQVTAKDNGSPQQSFTQTISFAVANVNEAPTAIQLTGSPVPENALGALVGTLSASDPDAGSTHAFETLDARFVIVGGTELRLAPAQSLNFEAGATINVEVTAKDNGTPQQSFTQTISFAVANVNEAPTAIQLTGSPVPENAAGAVVGTLTADDPDAGSTHTFETADVRFVIVGGTELRLAPAQSLNFEAGATIDVQITAKDNGAPQQSFTQTISFAVANVNEAPTALALTASPVPENAAGATIGTLSTTDPDLGDTHTYSTTDARFEFAGSTLKLKPGQSLDFEAAASVTISVTTRDAGALSHTQNVVIQVSNVNDPPSAIILTGAPIAENAPGVVVGTLSATDPETGDTHTFTTSDPRFEITGTNTLQLRTGQSLDFEAGATAFVSVTARDNGSPQQERTQNVAITVTNVNEPPTNLTLSRNSTFEDIAGAWVATVTVADPEGPTGFLHSIDDGRFEVRSGELYLKAGAVLDAATEPTVALQITATDPGGQSVTRPFTIQVKTPPAGPWEHPYQWLPNKYDVNLDGFVTALDAVLIINELNAGGIQSLPKPAGGTVAPPFYDVSGDDTINPFDAILVINYLNAGGGSEGEGPDAAADAPTAAPATAAIAPATASAPTAVDAALSDPAWLDVDHDQASLPYDCWPNFADDDDDDTGLGSESVAEDDFWDLAWAGG